MDNAISVAVYINISIESKLLNQIKNVLIIQLRQLGDILLTTPCPKVIKDNHPDAKVSFLSHKMGKLILEDNPFIDTLYYYDEKDSFKSQIQLLRKIRSEKFDLVIDYMNNPRSALFSFFSNSPMRISFKSSRSWAYSRVVKNDLVDQYIVKEKFLLLQSLGMKLQSERLILPWNLQHINPIKDFTSKINSEDRKKLRVLVSPTHRRENRKWNIQNYAKISDFLVKEWDANVIWIWGPGEEQEVEEGIKYCESKSQIFKAPPTSFRELAAFMGNCDLFIGNSNGPSHVAVSNDICSLQLHGHTNMYSWCPLNDKHHAIQSSEYLKPHATLEPIAVEIVISELKKMRPMIEKQWKSRIEVGLKTSFDS